MSESDGIDEAFEGTLRVAITAGAQLGEALARVREEQLARARTSSEQEGNEYAGRLHAERAGARAQLAPVHQEQWWDTATAESIGRAVTTAKAWESADPDAYRTLHRIREEVRDRYGVDVDQLGADPSAVQAALARRAALSIEADAQHSSGRDDVGEAVVLLSQADRLDRALDAELRIAALVDQQQPTVQGAHVAPVGGQVVEQQRPTQERVEAFASSGSELAYDSAERRQQTAANLEGKADAATITARMVADASQAKPATEAVLVRAVQAPHPASGRGTANQQRQRDGLGR